MKQVLHIFAKDVRRLWLEICLSFVSVALVAWDAWVLSGPARVEQYFNVLAPVLLLAGCWWLLVGRLVYEETLVGDRQFWITRPYQWHRLLVAKVLFVISFTILPLLLACCGLLNAGGFTLRGHIHSVAESMIVAVAVVIPAFALATVTRQLAQYLAGLVAMIAALVGLAFVSDRLPNSDIPGSGAVPEIYQVGCFLLLLVVCIFMQYRRRHTGKSASMLIAAFVLIPINLAFFPYAAMLERTFPPRALAEPADVMIRPLPLPEGQELFRPVGEDVVIGFPVVLEGIPKEDIVEVAGAMLTVIDPDGETWHTSWQQASRSALPPSLSTRFDLKISSKLYDRFRSVHSHARLTLALNILKDSGQRRVIAGRRFRVPDVGACWIGRSRDVECRTASNVPEYLLLRFRASDSTCDSTGDPAPAAAIAQQISSSPSAMPITPFAVHMFENLQWNVSGSYSRVEICPGTPVTFSTPEVSRRYRTTVDFGDIRLMDYRQQ